MQNKYLLKVAQLIGDETKHELRDTGVIAALGGIGNTVSDKLLHGHKGGSWKSFAYGTGIGLGADYAAVKLNKALGNRLDKKQS